MKTALNIKRRTGFAALMISALILTIIALPISFRTAASGGKSNRKDSRQQADALADYDVRTDPNAAVTIENFRAQAGLDNSQTRAKQENFRAGESALRGRVPTLKIEYNDTLSIPEVIATDLKAGKAVLTAASRAKKSEILRGFLAANNELVGLSENQINELRVTADYTNPDGVLSYAHLEQSIGDVPVFQAEVKAGFSKNGEIFRVINNLAPALDYYQISSNFGDPANAVGAAFKHVAREIRAEDSQINTAESTDSKAIFGAGNEATTVEKIYFPVDSGVARAAWRVLVWEPVNAYYLVIDAETGILLWRKNITAHQSQPVTYNVYTNSTSMIKVPDSPAPLSPGPVDPNLGTQGVLISRTNATLVGNETPHAFNNLGWITDGNNTTDGNNVEAGVDRISPDGVDAPVTGSGTRVFNFNYTPGNSGGGDDPLSPAAQKGAVVQMFYLTNRYHDELYKLGFTEAARNFQNDNFNRGGVGSDRVSAEGQDNTVNGSCPVAPCYNNANFATPPDGGRGRMQMYIYNGPNPNRDSMLDAEVMIHELTHGTAGRLVGNGTGLNGTMGSALNEGWADFYAHCLLSEPTDPLNGVYAEASYLYSNYYYGIRRFPKAVKSFTGGPNNRPHNPLTFADVDPAQADFSDGAFPPSGGPDFSTGHTPGEVWSTALWEARGKLIERNGAAEGNRRILQFATDGMKLTPNTPNYLQARDAVLAAAQAGGTANDVSDILAGFTIRGMGILAEITQNDPVRVVESFGTPLIVTNANDSGAGSLRQIVAVAPAGSQIGFDPAFFFQPRTITLMSGEILINKNLTITGTDALRLTISGNNQSRVFYIQAGTVTLKKMTVTGGNTANEGGGIQNSATLMLDQMQIAANASAKSGGGIDNIGTLTVSDSTISGNSTADANSGGGISSRGASTLTLSNTTVSGNSALNGDKNGGGIWTSSTTNITASTITDNNGGSGANSASGVFRSFGILFVRNSIIAANQNNQIRPDVATNTLGGQFVSSNYNLIGNVGAVTEFNQAQDQKGTSAAPLNPKLTALANNGGTTLTHKPAADSPVLDKGFSFDVTADQRGFTRPIDLAANANAAVGDAADIGAYEENSGTQAAPLVVTSDGDSVIGLPGCADGCSLREAIEAAVAGGTISFDPNYFNVARAITLGGTQLTVNKNLKIDGPGADKLTISANNLSRVFYTQSGSITLSGLTITGGNIVENGGGIYNAASLSVINCHITGNTAQKNGGGIITLNAGIGITGSTISDNTAKGNETGGGIDVYGGNLTLTNSTVSGNRTTGPNSAAGLMNHISAVTLISGSTFTNNVPQGANSAGGIIRMTGTLRIRSTIAAANGTFTDVGGTIVSEGYNLIGRIGTATGFNTQNDQTGNNGAPLNPLLDPLALNDGTTPTHALQANSPALDKGKTFERDFDQRNLPRPRDLIEYGNAAGGDGADIGAYEEQFGEQPPPIVTSNLDVVIGGSGCGDGCSLREAIATADAGATITFDPNFFAAPRTITLGGSRLAINKDLTIMGTGADKLTVSGDNRSGVFVTQAGVVTISNITITGGNDPDSGGAIYSNTTTNIIDCRITGNRANIYGGGIFNLYTQTYTPLTIIRTTIDNNQAQIGGGINVYGGNVIIRNSTISGNRTTDPDTGGGINQLFGSTTIANSTITNNTAIDVAGISGVSKDGGTITVRSSIIAANIDNSTKPDVRGAFVSNGFNLIGNVGAATGFTGQSDQKGGGANPFIDPLLAPLAPNNSVIPTHALQANSPAIDKGKSFEIYTDQRNLPRPKDLAAYTNTAGSDSSDIGAYEEQNGTPVLPVVNSALDATVGLPGCADGCSLREAVATAEVGGTINFDPAIFNNPQKITLGGTLVINKNLTINGTGADKLTVSGNMTNTVFAVTDAAVKISGTTITEGKSNGSGGGIYNTGTLIVSDCFITANTATYGGGIFSNAPSLAVINSTISNNRSTGSDTSGGGFSYGGGGIEISQGNFTMINSTVSGNRFELSNDGSAGGVWSRGDTAIINSTVANNEASGAGNTGGVMLVLSNTTISNSIIAANVSNSTLPDVVDGFSSVIASGGFNFIGNVGSVTAFNQPGDQTGGSGNPVINPQLAALALNNGKMPTHALLLNSPAMDKGKSFAFITDQRGFLRPFDNPSIPNAPNGDGADIGAVEMQSFAPTAASVAIGGRVSIADGSGVVGAQVTLTDTNGARRTVMTNSSGYYHFIEVRAGETCILTVQHKRFQFSAQVVSVTEDLTELNFIASQF